MNETKLIKMQDAIDVINGCAKYLNGWLKQAVIEEISTIPSAQTDQKTCLNCGRTANNGGFYEDGRTRCPIEEHYALPKDGYCHLWEKDKVWADEYISKDKQVNYLDLALRFLDKFKADNPDTKIIIDLPDNKGGTINIKDVLFYIDGYNNFVIDGE